jgi:hypothetical protein
MLRHKIFGKEARTLPLPPLHASRFSRWPAVFQIITAAGCRSSVQIRRIPAKAASSDISPISRPDLDLEHSGTAANLTLCSALRNERQFQLCHSETTVTSLYFHPHHENPPCNASSAVCLHPD